jgi:hypothetical protein
LHLTIQFERLEHCIENRARCWILRALKAVVHPLALSPRCNHTGIAQVGQVTGDLWLTQSQNFHQVADTNLSPCDQIQQAQPGPVCKGRK